MSNQAAWLPGAGQAFKVEAAEKYTPGADEVLVRNKAVAINPVDWKMQDTGFMIEKFPRILGCDVAGEVVEIGSNVSNVKVGDRVIGHCISLVTADARNAGFQLYTILTKNRVAKIPDSVSFAEGSVLPLAISTAVSGLQAPRRDGLLGLEYPTVDGRKEEHVIVVYGASSSVGAVTTQIAAKSGARVIALASPKNFQFCRDAGASEVLDYKEAGVVDKVVEAVKKTGLNFAGVYDAIALEGQSFNITIPILEKLGGGNLAPALPAPKSLPAGIKAGSILAPSPYTDPVWADFVSQALEKGTLKALPAAKVVGSGLEKINEAVDLNRKGVSASKIVVEL